MVGINHSMKFHMKFFFSKIYCIVRESNPGRPRGRRTLFHAKNLYTHETRKQKGIASSGNRTRAARVAGEHSTTEPTMLNCVIFEI